MAEAAAERGVALQAFLNEAGWGAARRRPLAGDASFRRYARLAESGRSAILMDAPPPQEDVRPFIAVARRLTAQGYSAPRIYAEDVARGFLILEDFGDDTYTRMLAKGGSERALYALAVDLLVDLNRRPARIAAGLPAYDDATLIEEACLLLEWYVPAMTGATPSAVLRRSYHQAWEEVLPILGGVPTTLVLRDYHVDNLMVLADRPGIRGCGLLDFQDAVAGPIGHDLVSLLEDARRDVPAEIRRDMVERYCQGIGGLDRELFAAAYAGLGLQRNLRIVGVFTRLCARDGKRHYLAHLPRLWRHIGEDLKHPRLAPLADWFRHHLPPERCGIPRLLVSA